MGKSLNLPIILWILHRLRLSSTKDLGKSDKSSIGIFLQIVHRLLATLVFSSSLICLDSNSKNKTIG